jgi:hypothetical protein
MNDKLPNTCQQDVERRSKRTVFSKLKNSFDRGSQPDGLRPFSRPGSPSHLSHRGKSPNPKNEKAENAQLTTSTNTATLEVTPGDNKNAWQGASTAAANPTKDNDMWAIAEENLRRDPPKRKILEEYDRILEDHFKSKLEPIGTPERRAQFLVFLNSEIEHLNSIDGETRLSRCTNKAKRFLKTAVDCVIATKDIVTVAAAPCLPASVACAGTMFLLSVSL